MDASDDKRGAIVDVLADDCGSGIDFLGPLDNGNGYWVMQGYGVGCMTMMCP